MTPPKGRSPGELMNALSRAGATVIIFGALGSYASSAYGSPVADVGTPALASAVVSQVAFSVRDLDILDGVAAGYHFHDYIFPSDPVRTRVLFDNQVAAETDDVFGAIYSDRRGLYENLYGEVTRGIDVLPIIKSGLEVSADVYGRRRDTQAKAESAFPGGMAIDSAFTILPNTELKISFSLRSQISYSDLAIGKSIIYAISRFDLLNPWGAPGDEYRSVADACYGSIMLPGLGQYDCQSFAGATTRDYFEYSGSFIIRTGSQALTYSDFSIESEVGYHTFLPAVPEPHPLGLTVLGLAGILWRRHQVRRPAPQCDG